MNTTQNVITKYTQVYDYLRTITLDEYLNNKRDIIHSELYSRAMKEFLSELNYFISKKMSETSNNQYDFVLDTEYKYKHISLIQTVYNDLEASFGGKENIPEVNEKNFRFIEYKNKNFLMPSKIRFVYKLIPKVFGVYSIDKYWNNSYNLKKNIDNMLSEYNTKYIITDINYITGFCKLYDKINDVTFYSSLDYINNLDNFEITGIFNDYSELFSNKR